MRPFGALLLLLGQSCLVLAANAAFPPIVPAGLLEPERAFALRARGLDAQTLEVRFEIARGYYLYKDKLQFSLASAPSAASPKFPAGESKQDPFFGNVEVYRDEVIIRLALSRGLPGRDVTLITESQGCADVGVCYPAVRQSLKVPLPKAGAAPGPFISAVPRKKTWFN